MSASTLVLASAGGSASLKPPLGAGAACVRRSGDCWVSQGTSERSGGRRFDALDLVAEEEAALRVGVGERRLVEQHAEPLAVGVTGAALPREARQRLRGLLVDRAARRELRVVDLVLGPGQDRLVLTLRRLGDLRVERHGLLGELRQRG